MQMSWQKIKVEAPFAMPDINVSVFPNRILILEIMVQHKAAE